MHKGLYGKKVGKQHAVLVVCTAHTHIHLEKRLFLDGGVCVCAPLPDTKHDDDKRNSLLFMKKYWLIW